MSKQKLTLRAAKAQKTKTNIFETALMLFRTYGYDNVTIDEITRSAGVSKGTFYSHFGNKESVLIAQYQKINNYYEDAFALIPSEITAGERLLFLAETIVRYNVDICDVDTMRIVYVSQLTNKHAMQLLYDKTRLIHRSLLETVEDGRNSGEFHFLISSEKLVDLIMSLIRGLVYDWCACDGKTNLKADTKNLFSVIVTCLQSGLLLTENNLENDL